MPREIGVVIRFIKEKGFGFIAAESNPEVFFHVSGVNDAGYDLDAGSPVEFDIGKGKDDRPAAKNVRVTGPLDPGHPLLRQDRSGVARRNPPAARPAASGRTGALGGILPETCVFTSFYGADGFLDQRLFFDAARDAAEIFERGVKPTQYRGLFQQFQALALPLRDNKKPFFWAREKFGVLYVERVVRAVERGVLPPVVKDLFDRHRDIVLADPREMLGFFRYVTNILCYFKKPS
ncbi:MAG: cold shock domain-containing protein [Planctomycetota bacterium]|jgi:cold shock CspA family protein|nr:cold shock domain-containing protein [Planctomycetota bacterium]